MNPSELNTNSKNSIQKGSKSFSFAATLFSNDLRNDVAHLYSWCRWCDDVADGSTLGFNQNPHGLSTLRVQQLRDQSLQALTGTSEGLDLPFVAFGSVMQKYEIPWLYAEDLLKGFDQDVIGEGCETFEDLLLYCYRVAGTVGLMMCHMMGLKNPMALEKAVHLGIALQLTNIARDVGDDFRVGKVYLPSKWLSEAKIPQKDLLNPLYADQLHQLVRKLLSNADHYYFSGLTGLKDLPWRCALAVAIAAQVYRRIGTLVIEKGPLSLQNRTSLSIWNRFISVCSGIYCFSKTLPSRIFNPRPTQKVNQIWRYP